MELDLPKEFIANINEKLGKEAESLLSAMHHDAFLSRRYNLAKRNDLEFDHKIGWCAHAEYLAKRPVFTLDPLFHAGEYYVQEPSSMILYHILKQKIKSVSSDLKILDLCASPGGKSTTILDFLKGKGCLVSNEVINARTISLQDNIIKWGYNNCIITNNDAKVFGAQTQGLFDVIVVDAPCSGEGMFRKDPKAACEWSLDNVKLCMERQQRILSDAMPALKEGGLLIYSTCTFNDAENIDLMDWASDNLDLESVPIDMQEGWGISEVIKNKSVGYHFYPHKVKGEGLFVAVMQKVKSESESRIEQYSPLEKLDKQQTTVLHDWLGTELADCMITQKGDVYHYNETTSVLVHHFLKRFKVKYSGIKLGHINKRLFIPHHALALANCIKLRVNEFEMNLEDAQNYLRKKLLKIESDQKGWMKVTYKGLGIGWLKNLGNRINNYLPNEIRIRNL